MRSLKDLQAYWRLHGHEDLVLCTVVGKTGSGYRGVGAKKIVRRDGGSCGYLSGGCLDGDIVRSAIDGWDRMPFRESFSTMSEEDRLMGYQTGCAGVIDILFERLPNDMARMHEYLPFGPARDIAGIGISLDEKTLGQRTVLKQLPDADEAVFIDPWVEPLHLYVLGCGPNAQPFADLVPPLGWDVTFLDYRQGNTVPERSGVQSRVVPVNDLGPAIAEGRRNAVLVMTHNYEADLSIIGQLNKKHFGYIGCVGPRERFDQIRNDLEKFHHIKVDDQWAAQVHAPAGLKQGRTSEDIAFSIIAEIQFGLAA